MVKGFPKEKFASCLKHFAGYGAVEAGKEYNTASMAPNILYNTYLSPFKKACEAGAMTVMAAFNDVNGVPCTTNSFLLKKILKESYSFSGFVVSDANAVEECVTHGIAENLKKPGLKLLMQVLIWIWALLVFLNTLQRACWKEE
jgi:beta-glucosidase